jgi:LytS/YehU family sensor histidine kinase
MKQFSHISKDYGFTSLVQLTKDVMTISVSDLDPIDFIKTDLLESIKKIDCPATAGVVLNLAESPNWDVRLDDKKVFDRMHAHFISHEMHVAAEALAEQRVHIFALHAKPLQHQWNNGISENLTRLVVRSGAMKTPEQEEAALKVIRKANPSLHSKVKHPRAKQFLETEWPIVYRKARSML